LGRIKQSKKLIGELIMNFIKKLFTFKWGWERKDPIEVYLSNSVDLVDLEQRQKRITYGTINPNLRGWV
tara:strand:+ start:834 stop:1040 length:207 start_codon:yes stop_codon:yes gene_type:complete